MLDLSGGAGLICLCIVDSPPSMKGVVFDQPAVVEVAKEFIKEYDMESRMEVRGGNYITDSIGEGYDLIFSSLALNFAKYNLDSLFKKIYDALNQGGVFIALQDGITNECTKPTELVLSFLSSTLMGQEIYFEKGEIADSMIRVGFKSVLSRSINFIGCTTDMDIARK